MRVKISASTDTCGTYRGKSKKMGNGSQLKEKKLKMLQWLMKKKRQKWTRGSHQSVRAFLLIVKAGGGKQKSHPEAEKEPFVKMALYSSFSADRVIGWLVIQVQGRALKLSTGLLICSLQCIIDTCSNTVPFLQLDRKNNSQCTR